ncbi:MAG TPA: TIGR02281 family clan AA aspartic protease [Sphingomonadaceae bacterium]|nr:TIGR02281 family clan AA aspartic protease [Sphingomonadaceae bacterium]
MDLHAFWDHLVGIVASVPRSGLLIATVLAVVIGVMGGFVKRGSPGLARLMRSGSTLALAGILVLVVLQVSRFDPRFEMAIPEIGLPEQQVAGGETRIPLAPDGHFWVRANVNGVPASFMVDTGATLTTLNEDTAAAAGLEPRQGGIPVIMQTANGPISARIATIDSLAFGNVEASGIDAAIAPNIGRTNVLGMNLLSRLASWRVEGQVMIMQPAPGDWSQAQDTN